MSVQRPEVDGISMQDDDAVAFLTAQHETIRALFTEVSAAQGADRTRAFEQLVRLLAVHETAEQQVLRPVTREVIDGGDTLADERIAEERQAKQMLVDLERIAPDAAEFLPELEKLRTAVLEHAENEEAHDFPGLREYGQAGEPLKAMIQAAEAVAPTHPHPSVNSSIAHTLTGPVVAIFDLVEDLLHKASGHGA